MAASTRPREPAAQPIPHPETMTAQSPIGSFRSDQIAVRPVGLDDWPAVRELHGRSFATLGDHDFDPEIATALRHLAATPDYTEDLQRSPLTGVWLDRTFLAGTVGWMAAADGGRAARITSLHVDPLFRRQGLGAFLVAEAETAASAAGFKTFTARVPESAARLLLGLGYEFMGQGSSSRGGVAFPVVFLRKAG